MQLGLAIGVCTLALVLSGCPREAPPLSPPEVPQPGPAAAPRESTDSSASDVTLQQLDWPQTEQLVAANKGQVVVLDIWSLSCIPCRAEFPHLVALAGDHPDDVACISVSTDSPKKQEQVLAFLEEQGATFDNVLCTENTDALFDQILKIGSMPAVYVYDRDGRLGKLFTGPTPDGEHYTYQDHIRPLVEELIKKQ